MRIKVQDQINKRLLCKPSQTQNEVKLKFCTLNKFLDVLNCVRNSSSSLWRYVCNFMKEVF